jgi:chaperone modulatory protein CbpM
MSDGKIVMSDEQTAITLIELCECSTFDEQFIIECVEHGVAPTSGTPTSGSPTSGSQVVEWTFSQTAVLRLQKAWRLHRDLDLQIGSLPLVLELLDERDQLLQEIAALRHHLAHWEQH